MIIIIFCVSLLLGLLFAYILRKLDIVDKPDNSRKLHKNPTPPAGGLVLMLICLYITYIYPNYLSKTQIIFLITLFLMGFLDDIFNLPVSIKLTVQLLGISLITFKSNMPIYYTFITTILYAIYLNSVNFIDNSSGTCLTFLIFSFLLLYIATLSNIFIYFLFSMLALLLLNLAFDKIFLGNNGSFFISAFLIVIIDKFFTQSTQYNESYHITYAHIIKNLFILFVPLLDFIFVTIRRIIEGHSIFKADNRHLSFTMEKIFNGSNYVLVVWNLLLYCIFLLNVILIKNNVPYIYGTPK